MSDFLAMRRTEYIASLHCRTQRTKSYEFGDSVSNMDIPGTLINAMLRNGPGLPMRLKPDDIEINL